MAAAKPMSLPPRPIAGSAVAVVKDIAPNLRCVAPTMTAKACAGLADRA